MTRPRTRLRRLIGRLGPEAYEAARAYAWRTAAGAGGRGGEPPDETADEPAVSVLHELAAMISDDERLSDRQRVGLAVFLYRQMPAYAVLTYTWQVYRDLGPAARAALWAAYRALLDEEDDRLAVPVAYSLWNDYFEDPATVDEAWAALTEPPELGRRATERLLEAAGPVPWRLKAPLYARLLPDPSWHRHLFESLRWSHQDADGQIDPERALRLLNRLRLPGATEGLTELRRALAEAKPARATAPRPRAARRG